jgi:hypothetical protein
VNSFYSNSRIGGNQYFQTPRRANGVRISAPYFYPPALENFYIFFDFERISFPNYATNRVSFCKDTLGQ